MKHNQITLLVAALALVSLFQNCGQNGKISVYSAEQNQTLADTLPSVPAADPQVDQTPISSNPPPATSPSPEYPIQKLRFTQMAAGQWNTCGIADSGGVYCTGSNQFGELGIGSNENVPRDRFYPVHGLETGVKKLWPSNMWSTCALLFSGDVKCWGRNYTGQLGDRTTEDRWEPVSVVGLKAKVSDISGTYPCFVLETGEAQCLPDMGTLIKSNQSGSTIVKISKGNSFACILNSQGKVECFGQNLYGVLGNGTQNAGSYQAPALVAGLTDIVDLVAGNEHVCALQDNGFVKCWGNNRFGSLGINSPDSSDNGKPGVANPTLVVGLPEKIISIQSMGGYSTCAIGETKKVYCWGGNFGFPKAIQAFQVTGLENIISVSMGNSSACFVNTQGLVKCSGTYLGIGQRSLENIPQY